MTLHDIAVRKASLDSLGRIRAFLCQTQYLSAVGTEHSTSNQVLVPATTSLPGGAPLSDGRNGLRQWRLSAKAPAAGDAPGRGANFCWEINVTQEMTVGTQRAVHNTSAKEG